MKSFLLKWLNGALGQPEFEATSYEDEIWPEDGFIRVPEFFEAPANPHTGIYGSAM